MTCIFIFKNQNYICLYVTYLTNTPSIFYIFVKDMLPIKSIFSLLKSKTNISSSLPLSMLANLLQCDVMFQLVSTVMKRAIDLRAGLFAESHLQKVSAQLFIPFPSHSPVLLPLSLHPRPST